MTAISRFFRSDRWIPWTFFLFFGVIITVNGIMIGFALDSWTGLAVDNSYRRGLEYNKQLDARAAQDALGWTVAFDAQANGDRAVSMIVQLTDRHDTEMNDATVTARLVRPTHEGFDSETVFDFTRNGRYAANFTFPMAGQWDIHLLVTRADQEHRSARRITVR